MFTFFTRICYGRREHSPAGRSIGGGSQRAIWPVDGLPLELQSDTKASAWESLAVDYPGEGSQVPIE